MFNNLLLVMYRVFQSNVGEGYRISGKLESRVYLKDIGHSLKGFCLKDFDSFRVSHKTEIRIRYIFLKAII